MTTHSIKTLALCHSIERLGASKELTDVLTLASSLSLDFNDLRTVNVRRCEAVFHPLNDWSPTDWATAMAGECGEACNLVKKLRRLDGGPNDAAVAEGLELLGKIEKELADLVIYADLLAARLGINLASAVIEKFNEVSAKVGAVQTL